VEASDIVSPEDARFNDLTNYWDDLHFHVANKPARSKK
jgi:hypothetical protein